MYTRNDPRLRRRLNQLSQNLESANENAQASLFTFSEHYLKPCFNSVSESLQSCQTTCFPTREERNRRHRGGATRGRAELSFDFYDDWEDDENDALLSWDNDEFDRLLGEDGPQDGNSQPPRQRIMSYGTRGDVGGGLPRRKGAVLPYDRGPDPTVIPSQSYFGFLGKLPFNIGRGGLRYKPSAANLQDQSGAPPRKTVTEGEALLDEVDPSRPSRGNQRRHRSNTQSSGHTEDSFSSRGDIFPSDEELDDAVPLDEEFAMNLERRTTNSAADESSTTKKKASKRKEGSRTTSRSHSSRSLAQSLKPGKNKSRQSVTDSVSSDPNMREVPSLSSLKEEEEKARKEADEEVQRKKQAAQKLAVERGLSSPVSPSTASSRDKDVEPLSPISPTPATPLVLEEPSNLDTAASAQPSSTTHSTTEAGDHVPDDKPV